MTLIVEVYDGVEKNQDEPDRVEAFLESETAIRTAFDEVFAMFDGEERVIPREEVPKGYLTGFYVVAHNGEALVYDTNADN